MEPGSEDEGPCNVASPSPVASPDSNNNSESGQSPPGSDNEDGSGQESGQEDNNNDEVTRDSGSEGQGDGAGSGSDNEKNSDAEVRSSPSSPAGENDSATGDRSAGEEENGEDGRESRQSSTSGAGGEQGTAEQAQSDSGQQQDDDEGPSCHDSPPASPSPSNTGAEERSSAPSSPVRRNSDDEKDSDGEDAKEAGSDKEEDEEDKEDSDKEDSDKEEDKDDSDNESNVGELIANIFGDSDDESEFEGFGKEDLVSTKKKDKAKKARKVLSDSEEEDDHEDKQEEKVADSDEDEEKDMEVSVEPEDQEADESEQPAPVAVSQAVPDVSSSDDELEPDSRRSRNSDFMSDFDIMMAKKKEENSKRRKRKDVDIISDTDDIIVEIIKEMKAAAEEDKELNLAKRAATKKLKLLPVVVPQLKKLDLKGAFLDQGVLHVMAEWLAPLPDKSLPHLQIREHMLRLLGEFPPLDQGFLKSSGIGRAVMYLYKHPKESKDNRERAGRLINEWARPIFNLNTNYSSISKEEREQKDFERMPQKRKIRMESTEEEPPSKKDIDRALTGEDKSLRPGEKGWVARARVPMPSTKDYVVRPKWNCDTEFVKNTKKTVTRLDKHMRMIQERKKKSKAQRAVTISIEGRHMSL